VAAGDERWPVIIAFDSNHDLVGEFVARRAF
jgi:hypothetical protein